MLKSAFYCYLKLTHEAVVAGKKVEVNWHRELRRILGSAHPAFRQQCDSSLRILYGYVLISIRFRPVLQRTKPFYEQHNKKLAIEYSQKEKNQPDLRLLGDDAASARSRLDIPSVRAARSCRPNEHSMRFERYYFGLEVKAQRLKSKTVNWHLSANRR
jgi:hypothetical protein